MTTVNKEQVPDGFYYNQRDELTRDAADRILNIVLSEFPWIKSALDVGCGTGTWLSVCKNKSVHRISGIEGDWVNLRNVVCEPDNLKILDLESEWVMDEKFDLGISLEVVEHLSPNAGMRVVKTLCESSEFILFSAATPGQGGNGHINLQWPRFWQTLFKSYGYFPLDIIRPQIWYDDSIPCWYRENCFLYAKKHVVSAYYQKLAAMVNDEDCLTLIPAVTRIAVAPSPLKKRIVRYLGRRIKNLLTVSIRKLNSES